MAGNPSPPGAARAPEPVEHGAAGAPLQWRSGAELARFVARRLGGLQLPQVAGSLTFTSLLALVPLLTIVLAIFTLFPAFGQLRSALDAWFVHNLMPKAIAVTISSNLTQFAAQAKGLSALGAVVLVFTATTTMNMVERAFNRIWNVKTPRPLSQRLLVYWALLTLGPLMFALSLTVSTQIFAAGGALGRNPGPFGQLLATLASLVITTGGYALLYMVVPNRPIRWRDALWGALAAALAFELAKRGFGLFIRQFPTYAIIYGALAALPLFLVWLYVTWLITLLGAVLAAALPVIRYERWWHQGVPGSVFIDAVQVLRILVQSPRAHATARVSLASLQRESGIGQDELLMLLSRMEQRGWVGRVQGEAGATAWARLVRQQQEDWVLLAPADQLRLADVYRLFVFGAQDGGAAVAALADTSGPAELLLARRVDALLERGLGQSLAVYCADPARAAGSSVATA